MTSPRRSKITNKTTATLPLTHLSLDKMVAISQTTFSNAFSWMKSFVFRFEFHWIFTHNGPIHNIPALVQIMAGRRPGDRPLSEPMMVRSLTQAIIWTIADPVQRRIYASLGGDELTASMIRSARDSQKSPKNWMLFLNKGNELCKAFTSC